MRTLLNMFALSAYSHAQAKKWHKLNLYTIEDDINWVNNWKLRSLQILKHIQF